MRKIVRKIHIRNYESDLALGQDEGKVTSSPKSPTAGPQELRETAYLISQSGAIIVSPEASQDKPAPKYDQQDPAQALDELLSNGLVTSVPGIQKILASDSGWQRLKDGSNKVIYWAKGRTTGWKLVLEVPYALIVAPARTLAEQSAIIGGVGLFLLIGVVFFTARRVSEGARLIGNLTPKTRRVCNTRNEAKSQLHDHRLWLANGSMVLQPFPQ
jgi:hypothetical protein